MQSDTESATTLSLGNFQSAVVLDMGVLKVRSTIYYGVLNILEVQLTTGYLQTATTNTSIRHYVCCLLLLSSH